jgi:diguanylate cyclase (GGDEF)-like protein
MKDLEQSNVLMEDANEKLRKLAITDGLTELYNHRHFKDVLETELTRAERYNRPLCLLMLDVDRFKDYNDTYGHPAGDVVLKSLAELITARLRDVDSSARYGGEEFAILLPETDKKSAELVAEDIRAQVENYPFKGRETQPEGKLTVSIGVAEFPGDSPDSASLIQRADEALYRAKSEGRNKVVCAE